MNKARFLVDHLNIKKQFFDRLVKNITQYDFTSKFEKKNYVLNDKLKLLKFKTSGKANHQITCS